MMQDTPIVNIEWDFNGLNPEVDFHGLKSLIKQLYGVDHELVELSALTDLILSQAEHVGTAVKCDGEENDPFAFISVLGVNQHNENDAIKSLLAYLRARLSTNQQISNILQLRPDVKLGLLFSERLINMPHQVVPPMYEMLEKELNLGGPDFAFTHLLIISRTYTEVQSALDAEDDRPQKKQKAKKQAELMYFHAEDEVLRKHALADEGFEYQRQMMLALVIPAEHSKRWATSHKDMPYCLMLPSLQLWCKL